MSDKAEDPVVKDSEVKEDTEKGSAPAEKVGVEIAPLENPQKSRWERSWPTIACGAGLFSDGYLNGVCLTLSPSGCRTVMSFRPSFLTRSTLGDRSSQYDSEHSLPQGVQ